MTNEQNAPDLFAPGALAPVPVRVPDDAWDNIVRERGIGWCCEWFGYAYAGEFAHETLRVLQERAAKEPTA